LLYTAVTRARHLAILVGTKKAIGIALRNDGMKKRFTGLKERLKKQ
jgi:exodeoxyribonuclease V alpha subunit